MNKKALVVSLIAEIIVIIVAWSVPSGDWSVGLRIVFVITYIAIAAIGFTVYLKGKH